MSKPDETIHEPLRFGRFTLQPDEHRLLRDGTEVPIGPRAFDVLTFLAARPGQLVGKEELLEHVWPNLVVEENNLQVQISTLRKVLGQDAIATVPGRGYRFTGKIAAASAPGAARAQKLPQPLTSFVGREDELARDAALLNETRLLTLTGIGGCGKTRLAIRLAEIVAANFRDGVCYVDLAPITDGERVALSVAAALGLREQPDEPIEDTLVRELAGRELLLVVDNCEHLLADCAVLLERVLLSAPEVRALLTSREGLGISGERTVAVRSLSMPPRQRVTPDALGAFESVRLFVDRARQVAPEFELDATNANVVVEICRRLDGIPLALELAAAWVRMLSIDQIAAKLDDRFRLLTGSARALPRQQTLLATLHWSYEHLTRSEQEMFRRLAVFTGGWTLAAALAVVQGDDDEMQCVERLSRLVDKSLVLVDRSAPEGPRYTMLETVREYARDRLTESGELGRHRDRHLDWFLALAQDTFPKFFTNEVKPATDRIAAELPNLLEAHRWCDEGGERVAKGLGLAAALRTFWLNRGQFALGQQVFEEALARPGAEECGMPRALALFAMAQHNYFRGIFARAIAPAEEALAISRAHADSRWTCLSLQLIARALCWIDDSPRAIAAADEALELAQELGDPQIIGTAMTARGELFRARGDFEAAAQAYSAAIEPLDEDPWNSSAGRCFFALAAIECGKFDRAREAIIRSVRQAMELGSTYGCIALWVATRLAAALGEWERAARLQGAFDAATLSIGGTPNAWDDAVSAKLREKPREKLGPGAWTKAHDAGRRLAVDEAFAELLGWLESDLCALDEQARPAERRRSTSSRRPS